MLGYCIIDNAPDNDTAHISVQAYLLSEGVIWSGEAHRLRCFRHVVNLITGVFTTNKPLKLPKAAEEAIRGAKPKIDKALKPKWVRPIDAILKLYIITVFIMLTSQRIEDFEKCVLAVKDKSLYLIKENDTRWFSKYLMLVRALELRNAIEHFT
jgi:hypothetical protein